ncbi:MAG: C25 family cysteine peptidase [Candidatus Sumerlaeota bacterium]|nr:C25 family cysteine peptidase [Candidatus Sumerlaeota bacterium]
MKKYGWLLFILTLLFLKVHLAAELPTTPEETTYQKNIQARILSYTAEEMHILVTNNNTPDHTIPDNLKQKKKIIIIIPENTNATIAVESALFGFYEKNFKIEEAKWGELKSYKLPEAGDLVIYETYGIFRSWRLASLEILTVNPIPTMAERNIRLLELKLHIRFTGAPPINDKEIMAHDAPSLKLRRVSDPLAENVLKGITVNPECMTAYHLNALPDNREFAPYRAFADCVNDKLTSGPAVKLFVYHGGLYGVSSDDLKNAGVPVERLEYNHLSLFHKEQQVPLYVDKTGAKYFAVGGKFYFYAPPFSDPKPYETYWLLFDKEGATTTPLRMARRNYFNEKGELLGELTRARQTARFFPKENYFHRLPTPLLNGNWFWDELKRGEFRFYYTECSAPEPGGENFTLNVHLTSQHPRLKSYCEIYWNKRYVGACSWDGYQNYTFTSKIPAKYLNDGENELTLYVPLRLEERQSPFINFIGFDVHYTSRLANNYSPLSFSLPMPTTPGFYDLKFAQPEGQSYYLLDVTDALNPVISDVIPISRSSSSDYNYLSRINLDRERRFILGSWTKAESVGAIVPAMPLKLLTPDAGEGDYIIITHKRLLDALQPFVELKKKSGFNVMLVDVDDIYDCFGFGEKDFTSLKRFFRYRYYYAPGPRLRYGLLVGETSDYIGDPAQIPVGALQDEVPVFNLGTSFVNVHSDTEYTLICGDDDLPDFALGRFPAYTPDEVATLIKKSQTYEGILPSIPAGWEATHAFVTDDESEFSQIAESIISNVFPTTTRIVRIYQQNYSYFDLLFIGKRKTSIKAREHLIDMMNKGILTLNYIGHGGPNLWTSERLFHLSDLEQVVNGDRLFFVTASTCDTSWLDYPTPPVNRSMGEKMVLHDKGGAIGVYGPTTGASPTDHKILIQMFYQGVLERGLHNFGEAIIYSKIAYRFEQNNKHLLDQFILLGDPALSFPHVDTGTKVTVHPIFINRRQGGKISVEGATKSQPFWGLTDVFIHSPGFEELPTDIKTHAFDGAFSMEYDIPPNAPAGKYNLCTYSLNPFLGLSEVGGAFFYVDDPKFELSLDIESQQPGKIYENEKVKVIPSVHNLSPFPLDNIQVQLRQKNITSPIFEKTITVPPMQRERFDFAWLAEAGVHTLFLEAVIPEEADSAKALATAGKEPLRVEKYVPVLSKTTLNRGEVNPDAIKTKPETLTDGVKPEFIVPVYNIGKMPYYRLRLYLLAGGSQIGTPKIINFLKSGQSIEVKYPSDAVFPMGNIPLDIRLEAFNQKSKNYDGVMHTTRLFNVGKGMDLVVLPDSVTFESDHFLTGETIFINAIVKNTGGQTAKNFMVQAFFEKPWRENAIIKSFFYSEGEKIDILRPGEEKKARLRWDPLGKTGKFGIYVVANSTRSIVERNYDNNTASGVVEILPHTNLALLMESVNLSRNILRKGDETDVKFTVKNDSDKPAGTFDVMFEEWGINLRPENCCDNIRIAGLAPGVSVDLATKWKYRPGHNKFRIEVNPNYLLQESNPNDNQAEYTFDIIEYSKNLAPAGEDTRAFQDTFMQGIGTEIEVNPLREIHPTNFENAKTIRFDIDKKYVVAGAPTQRDELPEDRDNEWALRHIWLASSPFENAPPISFSFPLPETLKTTMCDVYIDVQTLKDFKNYPASKVRLKVENEKTFKTYDFSTEERPYATQRYYIGRYDLVDRFLDVSIDDVTERYWTIVNHFEIVPIVSTYTSVAVEVAKDDRGKEFSLKFEEQTPGKSWIEHFYRFGTIKKEGTMTWGEWKAFDPKTALTLGTIQTPWLQWRTDLYGWYQDKPVLSDAVIKFKQ